MHGSGDSSNEVAGAPLVRGVALALAVAGAALGCADRSSVSRAERTPPADLVPLDSAEILRQRQERDASYRNDPDSPIPVADRPGFSGLSYYGIDESLAFVVSLNRYEEPVPVKMVTTEGMLRPAVKLGFVSFDREGKTHRLHVYQLRDLSAEAWESTFLPFLDGTTGEETYPAGRYVELVGAPDGWYLLDFNLAYHPLCAYGRSGYQCPRPPEENRLPFPVRAGERLPVEQEVLGATDAVTSDERSDVTVAAGRRR